MIASPVLSPEEQIRLCLQAQKRGKRARLAREKLVRSNWAFLCAAAYRYLPRVRTLTFEDLLIEGSLGMLRAIEKFEQKFKVRFLTYASPWVHSFMGRAIIEDQSFFGGGEAARRHGAYSYRNDLAALIASGKTQERAWRILAKRYKMSVGAVRSLETMVHTPLSLDAVRSEWGDTLRDILPAPDGEQERVDELDAKRKVHGALARLSLSEREKFIVAHRLLAEDPMTLSEIGAVIGITRERVRQVEGRLLKRMKNVLSGRPERAGGVGGTGKERKGFAPVAPVIPLAPLAPRALARTNERRQRRRA